MSKVRRRSNAHSNDKERGPVVIPDNKLQSHEIEMDIDDDKATPRFGFWDDFGNIVLLVVLYAMQGIPLGLTSSALPFLLQARLSYTQVGIFSMASYPYSLKLLWSPIVDSLYSARLGRRKSWIVPIQYALGALMIFSAGWLEERFDAADVWSLTYAFLVFVLLAATQDIAVDGWALTLLHKDNLAYAATCQTIGMNIGYYTSFTVFLALYSPDFCNQYLRVLPPRLGPLGPLLAPLLGAPGSAHGVVSISSYLLFWGWCFVGATTVLLLFIREGREQGEEGADKGWTGAWRALVDTYVQLCAVLRLPAMWRMILFLLTYRLGILVVESAGSLKLIDKGVSKEVLAGLVLVQFPVEMMSAVVAGRWAAHYSPYPPLMVSHFLRLLVACGSIYLIFIFPASAAHLSGDSFVYFIGIAALSVTTSFVSTLQFTSVASLFNTISDPDMGGSYLTLLNTLANLGWLAPKTPLFILMDKLTHVACLEPAADPMTHLQRTQLPYSCPKKPRDMVKDNECIAAGGVCVMQQDGFYVMAISCVVLGFALGLMYLRVLLNLVRLPLSSWRVKGKTGKDDPHTQ